MMDLFKLILHVLGSLFKSRAKLEAENLVLRQQVNVLRRQAPKRPLLNNTDRLLFVWLYRWFPSLLAAIAIVRPATVVRWHRAGFRAYWRWRSRNPVGRPRVSAELRKLIGEMSRANPLWGAPHIHGELLKLGFEIAQSTVARYMCRGPWPPSQGWRTFLKKHIDGIAAIDLFVLPTITFQILCDAKSDRGMDRAPGHRGVPMGQCASLPHSGSGYLIWPSLRAASARHGHSRSADRTPIAVAECVRRETDRHDPTGMSRPYDCVRRSAPAPDLGQICSLL